ncbi:MAG: hypothetical protein K0Q87_5303 [Neobacillus sp.]|nr:hypothetical protein [Neobacillus sp.]
MHTYHKLEQNTIIYELVSSECKTDGAEGAIVYGIKVVRPETDFNVIEDISVNEECVKELLYILKRAQVTPDQLIYIVEDFISNL